MNGKGPVGGDPSSSIDLIVVAAGSGERMGGIDKALVRVAGAPSLHRVLLAAAASPRIRRIVVVAAASRIASYAALPWFADRVTAVVAGGATRAASVLNGLDAMRRAPGDAAGALLVHDAARPGVRREDFEQVADAAMRSGAAAPALRLVDTIKAVDPSRPTSGAGTLDRDGMRAVQTPQGIAARHVDRVAERLASHGATATDELAVAEAIGIPVELVDGAERLRKITVPDDIRVLDALLAPVAPELAGLVAADVRVGWGDDAHPVGTEGALRLGGLAFPEHPALVGHSDGDVVLHAVADALLGAAGQGDLGRRFPADGRTPEGIDSARLLEQVRAEAAAAGVVALRVDLLITAREPRLAPRLEELGASVAGLLGLPVDAVNAKASSGNLVNDEGRGAAVRCTALLVARGPAAAGGPTSGSARGEGR